MKNGSATHDFSRLFYPFLHDEEANSLEDVLAGVKASALRKCADIVELRRGVLNESGAMIARCAEDMAAAFENGGKLLVFGNGGSATDAQDVACDCILGDLPALSLTNDIAVVTAVANDVGFDNVFGRQINACGKAGDIALGISTSGNSRNLETAFETAHKAGLLTIGLAGYNGGRTAELHRIGVVDFCFTVPSDYIPRIQEAQATIYHTLIELVKSGVTSSARKAS